MHRKWWEITLRTLFNIPIELTVVNKRSFCKRVFMPITISYEYIIWIVLVTFLSYWLISLHGHWLVMAWRRCGVWFVNPFRHTNCYDSRKVTPHMKSFINFTGFLGNLNHFYPMMMPGNFLLNESCYYFGRYDVQSEAVFPGQM